MVDAVTVVLAKKEVTYATDSAPTGGANAILTRNFSAKPIEVDQLQRQLDQIIYGAQASVPSNERQSCSYEVEIAGSGAAGTAPAWMELLEGCGMAAPVLTAGTDAVQQFAAAGTSPTSLTQWHSISDQLRKSVGVVGSFSMDFTAGAYPFFGFNWLGLIKPAGPFTKAAPPVADLARWKQPVEVNTDNTSFSFDAYSPKLKSFKAEAGVQTAVRNLVGSRYVRRGNHSLSGTAVVEAPDIAAKDYIARLRGGTLVPFQLIHGTVAGNIVQLNAAKVQITEIAESVEDDVLMWTMSMLFTVDGGSPDLILTAK